VRKSLVILFSHATLLGADACWRQSGRPEPEDEWGGGHVYKVPHEAVRN